jgi:hypothetical protein
MAWLFAPGPATKKVFVRQVDPTGIARLPEPGLFLGGFMSNRGISIFGLGFLIATIIPCSRSQAAEKISVKEMENLTGGYPYHYYSCVADGNNCNTMVATNQTTSDPCPIGQTCRKCTAAADMECKSFGYWFPWGYSCTELATQHCNDVGGHCAAQTCIPDSGGSTGGVYPNCAYLYQCQ